MTIVEARSWDEAKETIRRMVAESMPASIEDETEEEREELRRWHLRRARAGHDPGDEHR